MSLRVLALAAALSALPTLPSAATLAALEDEQSALFDRIAPAVVLIRSGEALGTGFAVAPDLVVTAGHNVQGATEVIVTLRDGRAFRAEVVEISRDGRDVALVRIPAAAEHVLDVSARPDVRTGSAVAVVGHGDRSLWSLSTGHVSNVAPAGPDAALLALQVPLRPGASGAPVVDRSGRVVGMVSYGAPGAIAFAVRSDGLLRSLAGLVAAEGKAISVMEGREAAVPPPLHAPELLFGPPDPRPPSAAARVLARTPERVGRAAARAGN
ncbi:MAG TPA: serine protease [Anaeromyxobacter sp.]